MLATVPASTNDVEFGKMGDRLVRRESEEILECTSESKYATCVVGEVLRFVFIMSRFGWRRDEVESICKELLLVWREGDGGEEIVNARASHECIKPFR